MLKGAKRSKIYGSRRNIDSIIRQAPDPPPVMLVYLRLLLNHLYGLEILNGQKLPDVASLVMEHGHSVRSIFLIQNEEISSRNTISALSQRGNLPVVLVMPSHLAESHVDICQGMKNVFISDWDKAVGNADTSLQTIVAGAFEAQGIGKLPTDDGELPHGLLKKRIQQRLKFGDALPTLPEIVLRITQMLADPRTTADDLEEVIATDYAIVHRLLHVVKSSVFQSTRTDGHWILKEAIVRLGSKQVGAVAQQVKLINSLVRPENSQYSGAIVRAVRKRMQSIVAAVDERDIRAIKGNRLEKLKGREGEHSIRLNKQWRLVITFEIRENRKCVVIVGIEDYH